MTRSSQPSSQDLHPIGGCTDQSARADLALRPQADCTIPPSDALLALARLLGRQAAREFLRGAEVGTTGSPLTGDPSDAPSQFPFPNGAQTDPSSDAF